MVLTAKEEAKLKNLDEKIGEGTATRQEVLRAIELKRRQGNA